MQSGGVSPTSAAFPSTVHDSIGPSPLSNSTPATNGATRTVICVFCGASTGTLPAYSAAARSLAQTMHKNGISLVYGGGTVGLMGEVARTLVALSGPESVHGVIPAALVKYEQGSESLNSDGTPNLAAGDGKVVGGGFPSYEVYGRTTVVKDMHTRKNMMAQEVLAGGPGSGFIALPGGYGTLEELMEVVTWNQLGIHARGVAVLNVEGYWNGLLKWVDDSVTAGFVKESNRGIVLQAETGEDAIRALRDYTAGEGRFALSWGEE